MSKQLHTYRIRLYYGIQYGTVYITAWSEAEAISKALNDNPSAVEAFAVKG